MDNRYQLNAFLAREEKKAFRIARLSSGNDEDALDVVQDAMLNFVKNYALKSEDQWRPLFYRVIYNRLTDLHRRQNFRQGIMRFFYHDVETDENEIERMPSTEIEPMEQLFVEDVNEQLQQAINELPIKQRQVVLMRAWQGFSTKETAEMMRISEGSIKTHYARGLGKLRLILGECEI